jgi:hypothetical protein
MIGQEALTNLGNLDARNSSPAGSEIRLHGHELHHTAVMTNRKKLWRDGAVRAKAPQQRRNTAPRPLH